MTDIIAMGALIMAVFVAAFWAAEKLARRMRKETDDAR